jgi:hypothetical protein
VQVIPSIAISAVTVAASVSGATFAALLLPPPHDTEMITRHRSIIRTENFLVIFLELRLNI